MARAFLVCIMAAAVLLAAQCHAEPSISFEVSETREDQYRLAVRASAGLDVSAMEIGVFEKDSGRFELETRIGATSASAMVRAAGWGEVVPLLEVDTPPSLAVLRS